MHESSVRVSTLNFSGSAPKPNPDTNTNPDPNATPDPTCKVSTPTTAGGRDYSG